VYKERSFVEYIQDLRIRAIRIAIVIGVASVFCMTFGIGIFNIGGYRIPLPYPDTINNIAIQVVLTMKKNLLPQSVNLIQLTPQGAPSLYSFSHLSTREDKCKKVYSICHSTVCNRLLILLLYSYTLHT